MGSTPDRADSSKQDRFSGKKVGSYTVGSLFSGGTGQANIYESEENTEVLLKIFHSMEDVARALREIEALKELKGHPGFVEILEHGFCGDFPYFAMKKISAVSLRSLLDKGPSVPHVVRNEGEDPLQGLLPTARALEIAYLLADAMSYAHGKTILHRDLKPENILMRGESFPVIIDLGLARQADSSTLTLSRSGFGTPRYMAPEQVEGTADDKKAPAIDVHALGIILYEMLPCAGGDQTSVLRWLNTRRIDRHSQVE